VQPAADRLEVRELPPGDWPGLQRRYLRYLPAGYDASRRWPLVLFLHGAGERGDNPRAVQVYGPPMQVAEGADLPFILVAPQCPPGQRWSAPSLAALLDQVERETAVDADRIAVTGVSMGGSGTWALATAQAQRFAAIAPVCGSGDPSTVAAIAHVPAWVFHGARDDVVPLRRSEEMVEALRRAGGSVRFTVYPEAGHDSWTLAYAEPELYPWLLEQRRR
jgi:predicted peptidase